MMNNNRKMILRGLTLAIAATVLSSSPASAELTDNESVEWTNKVFFDNLPVALFAAPQIVNGTMMVHGKDLLEGLGYSVRWNEADKSLRASHKNRPPLTFSAGRLEASIGEVEVKLQAAPYLSSQRMWIPLRAAAEGANLTVSWDPSQRLATVHDPLAMLRFSIVTRTDYGVMDSADKLWSFMHKQWKTDADLMFIPPVHYNQKINVMIAAGDLPDLVLVDDLYRFPQDMLESFTLDLTNELEAFPQLKKLAEPIQTRAGKLIGIARPYDSHNALFPAIRQDWLDVLGLSHPRTMDEVYQVLEAFTKLDPDGNGKHDTPGLSGYMTADGLGSLSWVEQVYTSSPDRFSLHNGQVVDHAVSPEQTEALRWLTRAYADGLIDQEFPIASAEYAWQRLTNHQSGFAAMTIQEAASLTTKEMEWVPLGRSQATSMSTPVSPWNSNGNGAYVITRMAKVQPSQLLGWMDRGLAMSERDSWDELKELEEDDLAAVSNIWGEENLLESVNQLPGLTQEQQQAYKAVIQDWKKTSYEGTTLPQARQVLTSAKYADMNRKLHQLKVKVILGAVSVQEWDRYVSVMKQSKIYEEMIAELNKSI